MSTPPTEITSYQHPIEKGGKYEPEAGRYVLYVSPGCPFASRALIMHGLAQLQDIIPVVNVHPVFGIVDETTGQRSWVFGDASHKQPPGPLATAQETATAEDREDEDYAWYLDNTDLKATTIAGLDVTDPFMKAKSLKEIYDLDNANTNTKYTARFTVPTLFDLKTKTIVSNESPHIMTLFDTAFNDLSPYKKANNNKSLLNPENIEQSVFDSFINEMNQGLVFKPFQVVMAKDYKTYLKNVKTLYATLDKFESILKKQRFLLGAEFSEADIRACVVLFRFDYVFARTFGCTYKTIRQDYPTIQQYLCDVHQNVFTTTALKQANQREHILLLSYCAKPEMSPYFIIPWQQKIDFNAEVKRVFE